MTQSLAHRELIIRYLLGHLPEEEQRRFEEAWLVDDVLFAELLAIESELIDSYVQNELSEEEGEQFESYFLQSKERRQRVELAGALKRMADGAMQEEVPPLGGSYLNSWWRTIKTWVGIRHSLILFIFALNISQN